MAHAIHKVVQKVPSPEDIRKDIRGQVDDSVVQSSEAIVQALHLLRELNDKELLSMCTALLEQGTEIIQIVVNQAGQPEYVNGLKNAIGLVQLLGQFDVSILSGLATAVTSAKRRVDQGEATQIDGVFKILALLRDPDVKAALTFIFEVLKAIGSTVRGGASGIGSTARPVENKL